MLNENVFAYRSFNPELETVQAFAGFGVDWVCIYPSNTLNSLGMPYSVYGPTWLPSRTICRPRPPCCTTWANSRVGGSSGAGA
jgi:hypothetical protein